ncbi:GPI-anchored protein LLG1-like isoform X2 [Ricinus communis]|uniref:GPI-anchored protein LLG1-like isoform X2 n=1 Tax=Ricinus communis TaxID=3988 RepID=UPI00201B3268|nr:GPI-anchored protein LLG1-like isoform X2 [Ricinus communis]
MFSYINLYGKYPPGLFASACQEGKKGLYCPATPPPHSPDACPVNFEFQNYTVITSQCKGPKYAPETCCAAFKEFACPFADVLNDLTNDCASTMFSYINLYGKYPPGLFASECREGKEGLECPAPPPSHLADDKNGQMMQNPSLMLTSGFLVLLVHLF